MADKPTPERDSRTLVDNQSAKEVHKVVKEAMEQKTKSDDAKGTGKK